MTKVTSKLQVIIPKKLAERYSIRPGDEIDWVAAGDVIRVIPRGARAVTLDRESQLRIFDQATERVRKRRIARQKKPLDRGWTRVDLYGHGRS